MMNNDQPDTGETLFALMSRDPLGYTKEDLDNIIFGYRKLRATHKLEGKPAKVAKPKAVKKTAVDADAGLSRLSDSLDIEL